MSNASAKDVGISVKTATFSDGKTINLNPGDIVVMVGPNNSGKSLCLRDIEQKIRHLDFDCHVVKKIQLAKTGTTAELQTHAEKVSVIHSKSPGNKLYSGLGYHFHESNLKNWWEHPIELAELSKFFSRRLSADDRLAAANPAPVFKVSSDPPSHPIHFLYRDEQQEKLISDNFKKAFGSDLIVHKAGGSEIPLHVGNLAKGKKAKVDRTSLAYCEELEKLPRIETQGDGMRSYAGILLNSILMNKDVTLIDEPEAFLHPPQARLLGRMLVEKTNVKQQLFIATHSSDILHGLLDTNSTRVRVVRIQREKDINRISELDSAGIQNLWADPLLRHSNILNGIFHQHVIVCESDSDCMFYQAIADFLDNGTDSRQPDVLFVHCGGKHRLAQVVKALKGLNVPTTVISDFDLIREAKDLQGVVEAFGGKWATFEKDLNIITKNVTQHKTELKTKEVKAEIDRLMALVTTPTLPGDIAKQINEVLRKSSPWAILKNAGRSGLPSGDATKAFDNLNKRLTGIGIFIVPVGQLEGFDRSIGNHGPKWVNEVLEKDLKDPCFDEAKKFIQSVYAEF